MYEKYNTHNNNILFNMSNTGESCRDVYVKSLKYPSQNVTGPSTRRQSFRDVRHRHADLQSKGHTIVNDSHARLFCIESDKNLSVYGGGACSVHYLHIPWYNEYNNTNAELPTSH